MNKEERIQYVLDNIKDNIVVNIALSLVEECDELQQELNQKNKIIEEIKEDIEYQLKRQNDIDKFAEENGYCLYNPVRMMIEHFKEKIEELEKALKSTAGLRERLEQLCKENNVNLTVPEIKYCTDNAAMIGAAAYVLYKNMGGHAYIKPAQNGFIEENQITNKIIIRL